MQFLSGHNSQEKQISWRMHETNIKNWIYAFKILKENKNAYLGVW